MDSSDNESRSRKKIRAQVSSSDDEIEISPSINLPTVPISNVSPKVGPSKDYSSFTLTTEPITIPPKEYEVIAENQLVTAVCMSNIFIIMNAMNIWFMT